MTDEIRFYRATGEYGYLSNLYPGLVPLDGLVFTSAEAAYQYGKFRDKDAAKWACRAPDPHLIAIVGHGLFPWDIVPNWSKIKVPRMRLVIAAKFDTDMALCKKLRGTWPATLIEDSKTDAFWGVGKKGDGKNMLGKLLMEYRDISIENFLAWTREHHP